MIANILTVFAIVIFDQSAKWLAVKYVKPVHTMPVIDNFLHFTYAENTGAAFSILQNQRWFFIIVTILVVFVLGAALVRMRPMERMLRVSILFVIGGALGNFYDRALRGYVVDMIDFQFVKFAIFNIADCFVVAGAALLILYVLVDERRKVKAVKEAYNDEKNKNKLRG